VTCCRGRRRTHTSTPAASSGSVPARSSTRAPGSSASPARAAASISATDGFPPFAAGAAGFAAAGFGAVACGPGMSARERDKTHSNGTVMPVGTGPDRRVRARRLCGTSKLQRGHPATRRNADRHQLHQRLCIWFKLRSELIGWMMEHDFLSGTEARAVPMTRETINTTC